MFIDADHGQFLGSRQGTPPDDAEQRVVADRQHEPLGQACAGPAAHGQAEVVDDGFETPSAAASLGDHRRIEPFGEYLTLAAPHIAPESPHQEPQANMAP